MNLPRIHLSRESRFTEPRNDTCVQLARAVLQAEGRSELGLSIALVDDEAIAAINEQYLQHLGPTDVISFPLFDPADCDPEPILGEVIVSLETACREAPSFKREARDEALLYLVHGMLHLLGYDDHEDQDRQRMSERQEQLLSEFLANEPK
jgi:probable rRNA maturation factor